MTTTILPARELTSPSARVAVPAHLMPLRTPVELLFLARQSLAEATHTPSDSLRYAAAHLAALRAAAAVLAAWARPEPRRRSSGKSSVWSLLAAVAPELEEWAMFFAAGAAKRAAAEAGIPRAVSAREADDLVRSAEQFIDLITGALKLTVQPTLTIAA